MNNIGNNQWGVDFVIDNSPVFDMSVDENLNDINMNIIYDNTLNHENLVIDADITGKTFNYLKNMENINKVTAIVPVSGAPVSSYFEYAWDYNAGYSGYTLFESRFESGWSAEFILGFNDAVNVSPMQNVLFYMGKIFNGNIIGTTVSGQTEEFIDNNFTVIMDNNKKLHFRKLVYKKSCECETAMDIIEDDVKKMNHSLTTLTGTSYHHLVLVWERSISLKGEELTYKGNNLNCGTFPNVHWYDGQKYREGRIKIYFDGMHKETVENIDETIFRETTNFLPQVQGWGFSDCFEFSRDYGIAGWFSGNLIRGRFYNTPFAFDVIKKNFNLFTPLYNLSNPLIPC